MYTHLREKRVLYIEDERDVLRNISELLTPFFQTIHTASSAEEGYRIFQKEKIDVVLVDIELPGMNGITFIKKVRERHLHLPVVVISAYTTTDYLLESIELHLDKYIVKPLTSRKIRQLLERLDSDFATEEVCLLYPNLFIDKTRSVIRIGTQEAALTKRELAFLVILVEKKIVSYDEMMYLWEEDIPSENAVRSFIKHLRKKLPPNLLKNRNGIGYYVDMA